MTLIWDVDLLLWIHDESRISLRKGFKGEVVSETGAAMLVFVLVR